MRRRRARRASKPANCHRHRAAASPCARALLTDASVVTLIADARRGRAVAGGERERAHGRSSETAGPGAVVDAWKSPAASAVGAANTPCALDRAPALGVNPVSGDQTDRPLDVARSSMSSATTAAPADAAAARAGAPRRCRSTAACAVS